MNHISNESMKAYLLRQLPEDQAAVLEEKYFTNREFFLKVQSAESALISDYLDGSLSPAEKQRFESLYLHVSLLQRRVEEVRQQRAARPSKSLAPVWPRLRLAAGIAAVLVVALGIWLYHSGSAKLPSAVPTQPQVQAVIAVRLTPGEVKGAGQQQKQFEPPPGSAINLVLEQPAQLSPAQYQVKIYRVDSDGRWTTLWKSPGPILSSREGNIQTLTLQISGSLLEPGDYVAETWTAEGKIQESYSYRILRT